jgi:hypothetical protein
MSNKPNAALVRRIADALVAGILTGPDWPNDQKELTRLQAAELLRMFAGVCEEAAKWVSVNDCLPELIPVGDPPHEFVARSDLVLVCGLIDEEWHYSVADLRRGGRGIEDRKVRWCADNDIFWDDEDLITHWMPLSTPDE